MSWKKLQAEGRVRTHKTSKKELSELRAIVARDLEDAAIQELSDDRRFATAYNAALQTAKMAIACAGYQLASTPGHHRLTFETVARFQHARTGKGASRRGGIVTRWYELERAGKLSDIPSDQPRISGALV